MQRKIIRKGKVHNNSRVEHDNKKKKFTIMKKAPKRRERKDMKQPISMRTKELKTLAQKMQKG